MQKIGIPIALFLLFQSLLSASAHAQNTVKIRKVDDLGNVVQMSPPTAAGFSFEWVFVKSNGLAEIQTGPCAEVRFHDPEVLMMAGMNVQNLDHSKVTFRGDEAVACLSHRSGGFSVQGRIHQKKVRYNYIIDLPLTAPKVIVSPECSRLKLKQKSSLNGDYLSVGIWCDPFTDEQLKTLKTLPFELQSEAMKKGDVQIRLPGTDYSKGYRKEKINEKQHETFVATSANGRNNGELALDWAGVPPELLPTPVPSPTPKKAPAKRFRSVYRGMLGFSSVNHMLTYATLTDNNKTWSSLQAHGLVEGLWRPANPNGLDTEADLHLEFLSKLPQDVYGSVSFNKRFFSAPAYDFYVGLGLNGVAMVGAQNFGLSQGFGVLARVRWEAKDNRWAVSGFFGPNLNTSMSPSNNWMNLKAFYRLKLGAAKFFDVGLDVNLINIPRTTVDDNVKYQYQSIALMFGIMGGR